MRRPKLLLALIALVGTTAAATAAHDLPGTWNLAVVTENGTGYPVLQLTQTGDSLKGTYTSNAMGNRTVAGIVYGDSMRFVLSSSMGGEGVVLTYLAKIVSADSLDGAVDFGGMGGAKFHGARQR
jgi:hypothetical protein